MPLRGNSVTHTQNPVSSVDENPVSGTPSKSSSPVRESLWDSLPHSGPSSSVTSVPGRGGGRVCQGLLLGRLEGRHAERVPPPHAVLQEVVRAAEAVVAGPLDGDT